MNTLLRKWSILTMLVISVFMISCDNEDPIIDVTDGLALADGYYLSLDGADPEASTQMVLEKVELPGSNAPVDRDGFYGNYIYLASGTYKLVEVEDREIIATLGATLAEKDTLATNDPTTGFKIGSPTEDADGFTLSNGFYKIAYDVETNEILVMEIETVSLIGSSTEGGWGSDTELTAQGAATEDGFEFESTGIILRSGAFKIRINNGWKMERFTEGGGYAAFTNYGGTEDLLVTGGADIEFTEEGEYTVNILLTNEGGAEMTLTRTGDAPVITFEPEEYAWGIIGFATTGDDTGWGQDIDMDYEGEAGGVHSWTGTYTLFAGAFKFRTNDDWAFAPNAPAYTLTGPDMADIDASGNDFVIAEGATYEFTISTADEGDSWSLNVDKQ